MKQKKFGNIAYKPLSKEEIRRKQILDGAFKAFVKKGYHSTKMEEIAKLSGVSKGTIYLYFKSKDDLFWQLMFDIINNYSEFVMNFVKQQENPVDKIIKLIEMFTMIPDWAQKDMKDMFAIFLDAYSQSAFSKSSESKMQNLYNLFNNLVRDIIKEGIEKGDFKPIDPDLFENVFVGLFDGLMVQLVFGIIKPDDKLKDLLTEMILNGIKIS